jgi:hypothetical protein
MMKLSLDTGIAAFALIAAVCWFLSAYGSVPPMLTYWHAAPPDDPFFVAVKRSAFWNFWAAGFSALSALCAMAQVLASRWIT